MLGWLRRRRDDPRTLLREALPGFELPTFRAIVLDAMGALRQPETSLADVGSIVGRDPGLTARVLRVANSPAYGLRHDVRSVEHAASLLGRSQLEALLVGVAVGEQLPRRPVGGHDPVRFWRAAARRATAARRLAGELHPTTRGESFTAALLQDMAVPLLAQARGNVYGGILDAWRAGDGSLAAIETDRMGFHHAHVAGAMAQHWGLPDALVTAVGAHHDAPPSDEGSAAEGHPDESDGLPAAVTLVAYLAEEPDGGASDPGGAAAVPGAEALIEDAYARHGLARERTASLLDAAFAEADEVARGFV